MRLPRESILNKKRRWNTTETPLEGRERKISQGRESEENQERSVAHAKGKKKIKVRVTTSAQSLREVRQMNTENYQLTLSTGR